MKQFDNEMDELFNKAGQDYPLNTNNSDWNAVQSALQSGNPPVTKKRASKGYLRYLPLLLLLLVPVVFLITNKNTHPSSASERISETSATTDAAAPNVPGSDDNEMKQQEKKLLPPPTPQASQKNTAPAENTNGTNNQSREETEGVGNSGNSDNAAKKPIATEPRENRIASTPDNRSLIRSGNPGSATATTNTGNRIDAGERKDGVPALNDHSGLHRVDALKGSVNTSAENNRWRSRAAFPSLMNEPFNKGFSSIDIPYPSEARRELFANTENGDNKGVKEKAKPFERRKEIYYGLKVGPDLSMIKGQKVDNTGYAIGLIAGYQFSPRWSVEISGLWSSKKYYSDGKYFDKTSAQMPANLYLMQVDGECKMIEVPVAVRYIFSKSQNSFFVTAGFNTYFMNKEHYDYEADAGWGAYWGYKNYSNPGNYFFSNLQLSGGYQFKVFNKTNIRIEPYLQLPLSKVGTGRMPITSAGVHLGLLRESR